MTEQNTPYVVRVHEPEDQRRHPVFAMFERPIAFHRIFVTLTCSVTAALMLSQAVYWSSRTRNPAGWFFKSAEEWEEETGLTRREQETARKKLRQFEWWQEDLRKANGVPTMHYRIDAVGFAQTINSGFDKCAKPDCTNAPNPTVSTNAPNLLTETTKEHDHPTTLPLTGDTTNTDDAMALVKLIQANGFVYLDKSPTALAAQLIDRFGWERCASAVEKAKEAHYKQAKTGRRGIVSPLAYLRSILEEQAETEAESNKGFESNAWQQLGDMPDYMRS